MIFNKYQLSENIQHHGYSFTAKIQDQGGEYFFAKWIKGIKKNSQQSRLLKDKLRHLKKVNHPSLPRIIEYDWDENHNAYCIIYQYTKGETLEDKLNFIKLTPFLKGIEQIIDCLKYLLSNHHLSHGDITPTNIFIDENFNFLLIDFGLSDITATLSEEESSIIFSKEFSAPEKWDPQLKGKGFLYQADIYSLGRVIDWFFKKKHLPRNEDIDNLISHACQKEPSRRLDYNSFLKKITDITHKLTFYIDKNFVKIESENNLKIFNALLEDLNNLQYLPKFDINTNNKNNTKIKFKISTQKYISSGYWDSQHCKIVIYHIQHKEENEEAWKYANRDGFSIPFPVFFESNIDDHINPMNLTIFFRKISKQRIQEREYRIRKKKLIKELDFYKGLIHKELDVIEKNTLKLRYTNFKKEGEYGISFVIEENEKYSSNGFIFTHIDRATPPNSEEFEYIISKSADDKQKRTPIKFTGIAYNFNTKKRILKFKDCENLDFNQIPQSGYLFENTMKREEEKKRQLEAIKKVEYDEVQNRDLIYYLFNPEDLRSKYLGVLDLHNIYQTDEKGQPFTYSDNQTKAILNAIYREPLTIIQGPPGTGKTTIITEIVFQILHKNPDAKILITSQTNNAVDNVLDNLLEKNIPVVRLSGFRNPKESLRKHTLEKKLEGWKQNVRNKAKQNWEKYKEEFRKKLEKENKTILPIFDILLTDKDWHIKKQQISKLLPGINILKHLVNLIEFQDGFIEALNSYTIIDIKDYFKKERIYKDWLAIVSSLNEDSRIHQKLIDTIRVIGATTNHIASKKYKKYNFDFDYVIMDESGKATVAESLIPLVMADKAILVGDHRQLRPMLTSNREVEKWLREKYKQDDEEFDSWDDYFNRPSLFEQIITRIDNDFKSQLDICRRMPAESVKLTSRCFYEPYGDNPILPIDRPSSKEHNLNLKINSSIIFIDIGNSYKSKMDGIGSSYNEISIKQIFEILKELDKFEIVKNYTIGIISGYTAQQKRIKNRMRKEFKKTRLKNIQLYSDQVTISIIDKFQGLEKDIIIFDLVRSRQNTLGFLANANRINVALSRHKRLLIMIGNYDWLIQAQAPNINDTTPALQLYLEQLKPEWIVKNIKQVF